MIITKRSLAKQAQLGLHFQETAGTVCHTRQPRAREGGGEGENVGTRYHECLLPDQAQLHHFLAIGRRYRRQRGAARLTTVGKPCPGGSVPVVFKGRQLQYQSLRQHGPSAMLGVLCCDIHRNLCVCVLCAWLSANEVSQKISDETFYAQSQIMVENVPEFSAESLCLRQGVLTS